MKINRENRHWILLILFSLVIRLIGLGHRAMSHDESLHALYSWNLSQGLNYQHDPMMHGPLLFHLNGLIYALFPVNDFTSLLLPALWGTGCVALLYLFRRWLGTAGAFCAAMFISLDPGHLFYSRYLRNDIMVSFFTLLMLWAILDYRETRRARSLVWLGFGLGLQFVTKETSYILGTVFGAACVTFSALETRADSFGAWCRRWTAHPLMHCALLLLLLALPFAGSLLHPLLGWDPLDNRSPEGQKRIFLVAGWLWIIAGLSGVLYFKRQGKLQAFGEALSAFWMLQMLLYTTLFHNSAHGMASGLAGSLGYWLAQHEVQRGNPDPFFYVTLLLLYTPVLLAGALLSLRKFFQWPMPFFWFWALGNLLIFSWAGERMPWLLLHISLPLCLITGTMLPPLFDAPARRILKTLMALGCFQLVVNSLRLSGPLSEGALEPLVYAHSGPEVKSSLILIEEHLQKYPGSRVRVDDNFAWPLAWYFRQSPVDYQAEISLPVSEDISVLLIPPLREKEFQNQGWVSRMRVDMTTWPRPQYHRISLENLDSLARLPAVRRKFLRYYFFRQQPEWGENEWPVPNRYLLMTRPVGESM